MENQIHYKKQTFPLPFSKNREKQITKLRKPRTEFPNTHTDNASPMSIAFPMLTHAVPHRPYLTQRS